MLYGLKFALIDMCKGAVFISKANILISVRKSRSDKLLKYFFCMICVRDFWSWSSEYTKLESSE